MNETKHFNMVTKDWRDGLTFIGTQKEYDAFLADGCYKMVGRTFGLRYDDGHVSVQTTISAGPLDGYYLDSGAFCSRFPHRDAIHRSHFNKKEL